MATAVKKESKQVKEPITTIVKEKEKPLIKKEKWAKARFNWLEMSEFPGCTWTCSPNCQPEAFKDGEVYDRPLALFEMLNRECRRVRRKKVKRSSEELAKWVKTKQYDRRINFEILEVYDKEIKLQDYELDE